MIMRVRAPWALNVPVRAPAPLGALPVAAPPTAVVPVVLSVRSVLALRLRLEGVAALDRGAAGGLAEQAHPGVTDRNPRLPSVESHHDVHLAVAVHVDAMGAVTTVIP